MKKILAVAIILLFFLNGCKKTGNPCSNCLITTCPNCPDESFPSPPAIGYTMVYDSNYISWPYANPNNSNEIIYYTPISSTGTNALVKFNITTKQKQILNTSSELYPPKWGRTGWILLNINNQVWKITPNGDSLTQLTFTGQNYGPEWNYNGDKFIAEHEENGFYNSLIYDMNGNVIDTLGNGLDDAYWQSDSLILFVYADGSAVGIDNVNNNTGYKIATESNSNNIIMSALWTPDYQNVIYSNATNIYAYSLTSKYITCLKQKCTDDQYLNPSVINGNQILFEKDHWKGKAEGFIFITDTLVIINPDGSDEHAIQLQ